MTKKFSIYAGPPISAALRATRDDADGGNRSGRLNIVVGRYNEVVAAELRTIAMPTAPWLTLMDVLSEGPHKGDDLADLPALIADSSRVPEEHRHLARAVAGFSVAARVALAEAADRFHARREAGMALEDALAAAGITPTGE